MERNGYAKRVGERAEESTFRDLLRKVRRESFAQELCDTLIGVIFGGGDRSSHGAMCVPKRCEASHRTFHPHGAVGALRKEHVRFERLQPPVIRVGWEYERK